MWLLGEAAQRGGHRQRGAGRGCGRRAWGPGRCGAVLGVLDALEQLQDCGIDLVVDGGGHNGLSSCFEEPFVLVGVAVRTGSGASASTGAAKGTGAANGTAIAVPVVGLAPTAIINQVIYVWLIVYRHYQCDGAGSWVLSWSKVQLP